MKPNRKSLGNCFLKDVHLFTSLSWCKGLLKNVHLVTWLEKKKEKKKKEPKHCYLSTHNILSISRCLCPRPFFTVTPEKLTQSSTKSPVCTCSTVTEHPATLKKVGPSCTASVLVPAIECRALCYSYFLWHSHPLCSHESERERERELTEIKI